MASVWLKSIASQAESVLNQIDESAASALTQPDSDGEQLASRGKTPGGARKKMTSSRARKHASGAESQDELSRSRKSSTSSVQSTRSEGGMQFNVGSTPGGTLPTSPDPPEFFSPSNQPVSEAENITPPGSHTSEMSSFSLIEHSHSHGHEVSVGGGGAGNSALETENRLLKNELQSLNSELNDRIRRSKQKEAQFKQLQSDYEEKSSENNELFKRLQSLELDLAEEVRVKESQLAGFRLKIDQLNSLVASRDDVISKLEQEKQRILSDHVTSAGLQEQSVLTLQQQVSAVEQRLQAELQQERSEKTETQNRLNAAQNSIQELSEEISSLNAKLSREKQTSSDYQRQLNTCRQATDQAKQDLVDYKNKAQKILQSKDKLISDLTSAAASGSGGDESSENSRVNMLKLELTESKAETESLRNELARVTSQLEERRSAEQDAEQNFLSELEELREELRTLQLSVDQEKHKNSMLEDDLLRAREESNFTNREILSLKETLSRTVHEKDAVINQLRSAASSRFGGAGGGAGAEQQSAAEQYEKRIASLTETVLVKQQHIERLNTEKQSLNFQLERLSLQSASNNQPRGGATRIHISDDTPGGPSDSRGYPGRGAIPAFLRESAFDNNAVKMAKRMVVVIDRFSLQIGVYFRQFALARVLIVVYALVLHLWVTIVLATYKPEIHSDLLLNPPPLNAAAQLNPSPP